MCLTCITVEIPLNKRKYPQKIQKVSQTNQNQKKLFTLFLIHKSQIILDQLTSQAHYQIQLNTIDRFYVIQ